MEIELKSELAKERDKAYRKYVELEWQVFCQRPHSFNGGKMSFDNVIASLRNHIHPPPESQRKEFEKAIEILSKGQAYLTKDEPKRIVFFDDNAE